MMPIASGISDGKRAAATPASTSAATANTIYAIASGDIRMFIVLKYFLFQKSFSWACLSHEMCNSNNGG
jgi:hypothetical protein